MHYREDVSTSAYLSHIYRISIAHRKQTTNNIHNRSVSLPLFPQIRLGDLGESLSLSYRTLPYRTVPYLTLPYRTLPYHTLPYLTLPYRTLPLDGTGLIRHGIQSLN